MSTIPAPASILEALDMIEDATSYFETAEFKAVPVKTRLEYLEALDQVIATTRVLKAQLLTEYIRRRWDGTVNRAYERPITGSAKASSSGVRGRR